LRSAIPIEAPIGERSGEMQASRERRQNLLT
jgi:hypothetical protein